MQTQLPFVESFHEPAPVENGKGAGFVRKPVPGSDEAAGKGFLGTLEDFQDVASSSPGPRPSPVKMNTAGAHGAPRNEKGSGRNDANDIAAASEATGSLIAVAPETFGSLMDIAPEAFGSLWPETGPAGSNRMPNLEGPIGGTPDGEPGIVDWTADLDGVVESAASAPDPVSWVADDMAPVHPPSGETDTLRTGQTVDGSSNRLFRAVPGSGQPGDTGSIAVHPHPMQTLAGQTGEHSQALRPNSGSQDSTDENQSSTEPGEIHGLTSKTWGDTRQTGGGVPFQPMVGSDGAERSGTRLAEFDRPVYSPESHGRPSPFHPASGERSAGGDPVWTTDRPGQQADTLAADQTATPPSLTGKMSKGMPAPHPASVTESSGPHGVEQVVPDENEPGVDGVHAAIKTAHPDTRNAAQGIDRPRFDAGRSSSAPVMDANTRPHVDAGRSTSVPVMDANTRPHVDAGRSSSDPVMDANTRPDDDPEGRAALHQASTAAGPGKSANQVTGERGTVHNVPDPAIRVESVSVNASAGHGEGKSVPPGPAGLNGMETAAPAVQPLRGLQEEEATVKPPVPKAPAAGQAVETSPLFGNRSAGHPDGALAAGTGDSAAVFGSTRGAAAGMAPGEKPGPKAQGSTVNRRFAADEKTSGKSVGRSSTETAAPVVQGDATVRTALFSPGDALGGSAGAGDTLVPDSVDTPTGPVHPTSQSAEKGQPMAGTTHETPELTDTDPPEFMAKFTDRAAMTLKNGQSEMQMVLKPASLGQLLMQVTTENHRVMVTIVTETSAAKEAIENNLGQLKADLQAHGLEVDTFDVTTSHDSQKDGRGSRHLAFYRSGSDKEAARPEDREKSEGAAAETLHPGENAANSGRIDFFA